MHTPCLELERYRHYSEPKRRGGHDGYWSMRGGDAMNLFEAAHDGAEQKEEAEGGDAERATWMGHLVLEFGRGADVLAIVLRRSRVYVRNNR